MSSLMNKHKSLLADTPTDDVIEDTNHLYLESLQSGMPRLSDISHASDGKIHVDRLRLAPVLTNDVDEDLKTPDIGSPYPTFRPKNNKNNENINANKHNRDSSLGTINTIQSNAGTIGTLDVREYQNESNAYPQHTNNIRPHITHKKQQKTPTKSSGADIDDDDIENDAASEIPPLPSSTQIKPLQSPTNKLTNKSSQSSSSRMTNLSTVAQDRSTIAMNKSRSNSKVVKKGMYLDDNTASIDIDNIQFDDEVDLTEESIKNRKKRSQSVDSRKSVRFHDPSRNTFLSPVPRPSDNPMDDAKVENVQEIEFPGISFASPNKPDLVPQSSAYRDRNTTSAPMRFRGPARIALLNKYIAMDPFQGDMEINQWSIGDVKVWISSLEGGVNIYSQHFALNHIKGCDLLQLTNDDLLHQLNIKSVGHRQIIMSAIDELKQCVIVEINNDRFLVPPKGAVMRFEDVSVQRRVDSKMQTFLGHATGTFLPNQITAIMGDTQKSLLLKVLSGYHMNADDNVSGHIFINGHPIDGSLVNAGLASYTNGDDCYNNFDKTTVDDLVRFYVKLSGDNADYHHHNALDSTYEELVNHVLRISDINYPKRTKMSELKAIQYKRLMIAIDVILFDIKLIFLDKILDGLTHSECTDMMQMIYAFSRKLDVTFILSVERIRYHILNAYFDQVIVVGGVDANKIVSDCTQYYKHADDDANDVNNEVAASSGSNSSSNSEDDIEYLANYERTRRKHNTMHNDLNHSATSIRFVGRPEDVMEYFRLKQVEFVQTENPIEVIYEHVVHNFELIEAELESDYFRYRQRSQSLSPFMINNEPRNGYFYEIWILTQFILTIGWREWNFLYACLRIIVYSLIVGAVFWDVSCEKYFLNERLLAIFVISCVPIAAVWPLLDFHRLHRDFWFEHILFRKRARFASFICAILILCCTHAAIIGIFSFVPWLMEDLGCNDFIAFVRIGFMQFFTANIYAIIALISAEVFIINKLRITSLICTSSVLFAGALVHSGHISNRPGTAFINIDFLKYSLEFLLFTDVDYIQQDATCKDYLSSLEERQYFDRDFVDLMVIFIWIALLIFIFSFLLRHQYLEKLAYCSQFTIGRLASYKNKNEFQINLPSLPASAIPSPPNEVKVTDNVDNDNDNAHERSGTALSTHVIPRHTAFSANNSNANTPNILPLASPAQNIGMTSTISNAIGSFQPLQIHNRTDSDQRFGSMALKKEVSMESATSPVSTGSETPLPFQTPDLTHQRARSKVTQHENPNDQDDLLSPRSTKAPTPSMQANHSQNTNITTHSHQISLSGLETINEKDTEELGAVPPSTSNSLLLRQQHIASGHVPPPNVRILSTLTTRGSVASQQRDSRYSGISSFTPLRQQSLMGRLSFSNRRRSSVNMKSQSVPRFLAISPAVSLNKPILPDEDSKNIKHAKHTKSSMSFNAVKIPFDEEKADNSLTVPRGRLPTIQSQETLNIPRKSRELVIEDFADDGFEQRMKSSPLIFYDVSIVDKFKNLVFNKVSGHVIENGVTLLLAPSDVDTHPLLRAIGGIYSENLLYMEGKIVIKGCELLTEIKLAQNRIIAYVPQNPVLPDLISVQEIIRLAFILTEPDVDTQHNVHYMDNDNVCTILRTMELLHLRDYKVSQLSRMDYLKVAIAYCGLRSKAGIVFIENVYTDLNIIEQKQLIRCIHRLSQVHKLSILTTMYELTLESIQQDHINHIILLSSAIPGGITPIYEGSIQEILNTIPKVFTFKKFENVIDEILDVTNKTDKESQQKLLILCHDLRDANQREEQLLITNPYRSFGRKTDNKWLEYWWLGWLYWRFVSNHKTMFFWALFKLFIYVFVVCLAFWNLPSTESGSKSMFGAMNALLFIFIMQTPANHRLFLPLLSLGIQDWQSGKYSLNMMSTLHCWAQYLLSIVLATMTAVLSYWTVNFNDPATALGSSILLFTMGFVYSAGVWDSIYFLLFACGCSPNLSFFIMAHLLLYFWLFSGCFILKGSMPFMLQIIGYYANPVRLTLESQYCAIILPKTFGNERGSDILAQSDYDCAIGFDLSLVFAITFVLRIVGSLILAYRYECIPLYNHLVNEELMNHPNDYGVLNMDESDSESAGNDGGDDGQPANIPMIKARESKEANPETMKRRSRHKGHYSVDHIPTVGSINFTMDANDHYINMDDDDDNVQNESKEEEEKDGKKGKSLIKGIKQYVGKKLKERNENKNENKIGLLQHDINMDDMNGNEDEEESDSELINLENEYHAFDDDNAGGNGNSNTRINYGNNANNKYQTMILGTGGDDSDDMLL